MTAPTPAGPADDAPAAAGLYGAAAVYAGFRPTPVVTLGGAELSPARGAAQVVLEGLSVSWGRSGVLEQPEPATASFSLFDATGTWALRQDLLGASVRFSWTSPTVTGETMFRGRVASVDVAPRTLDGVPGALVEFTATSLLADLANRTPAEAWPEETLAARRTRLAAACAYVLTGGIMTRPAWDPPMVAAVPADRQVSLYDHLVALYESCGADRMTYLPQHNMTTYVVRPDYDGQRTMGQLWWKVAADNHPRSGRGAYARPRSVAAVGGNAPVVVTGLPADALEFPDTLQRGPGQRLTRVSVTHSSATTNTDRTVTVLVPGVDESLVGTRGLAQSSIVRWDAWADLAASDLREVAQEEGAGWRPAGALRLSTRKVGGFEDGDQALLLLAAAQLDALVFLQGSWLSRLGVRPLVQIIGGAVGYTRGGWDVDLEVQPIVTPTPGQHPISWAEIDDGSAGFQLQWWDDDHPRGLHPSLTYDDMQWVGRGLAVNATPANNGWDYDYL